jgi:hypothetical protein
MMYDMTQIQEEVVGKIEKMGFRFTEVSRYGDAYLHRKKGGSTLYADVDREGLVMGMSFMDWKTGIEKVFDKNNKRIS